MNNSTVNLPPEASTNSTTQKSFELIDYLEITMFSINLLFSFPIHLYIIWLIVARTVRGVAFEYFNLNLCVCEIGICMNSFVFLLSRRFTSFQTLDHFLMGLTFTGRPLFQCLMCVERYLAVVHPVTFLKYKPFRYRVICCTAAWIVSLGSCGVCLLNVATKKYRGQAWFSLVGLTLIISIQLFCLVAVLRALKQSGPGERKREEENQMKRRAFNLILIATVNMIVLYFPFTIISIFIIFTAESTSTVWFTGYICFILAGFVQPFVFLRRAGKLCLRSS